jgi:hypothetical protein
MADQEEIEETYDEPVSKLPITVSLEPCKSKFFTADHTGFVEELKSGKFRVFSAVYNYNDDYEGSPAFVVKNFVNGLIQQLDDKRKYLFVSFKCTKTESKYCITSTWITNCTLEMPELIPEKYEDFTWKQMDLTEENCFATILDSFVKKEDDESVIITAHVH